jgi:hypothetical protein
MKLQTNINYIICSVILKKEMALSVLLFYLNNTVYTDKITVDVFFPEIIKNKPIRASSVIVGTIPNTINSRPNIITIIITNITETVVNPARYLSVVLLNL